MSRPSTVAEPPSGSNSVVSIRNNVVLPAPSGPIRPNNSPAVTSSVTASTATILPASNVFDNSLTLTIAVPLEFNLSVHSDLQIAVVLHAYFGSVHKIGTLLLRLNGLRCELCFRRDPRDGARILLVTARAVVDEHGHILVQLRLR